MTSPSSYIFYDRRNSSCVRAEGTYLIRVFITGNKITVYEKEIVTTAKSGVLFEKITAQRTYALETNSNGDKYLRIFNKSAGGSITDGSMTEFSADTELFFSYYVSNDSYSALIEETLCQWFGLQYSSGVIEKFKNMILFPVMQDSSAKLGRAEKRILAEVQTCTSTVTKAMRENNNWDSLLQSLGSSIQSSEDSDIILKDFSLLPFAVIKLGQPFSDIHSQFPEETKAFNQVFNEFDIKCLRFMFDNITEAERSRALKMVMSIIRLRRENTNVTGKSRRVFHNGKAPFHRVPKKLRSSLAGAFFMSLIDVEYGLYHEITHYEGSYLSVQFWNICRYWYAEFIMEPLLKSEITSIDVETLFIELFNTPCEMGSQGIKFHNLKSGQVFCSISSSYSGGVVEYQTDLFTSLAALAKCRIKSKGTDTTLLNGYLNPEGKFIPLTGKIYSLDDLMNIVQSAVTELDKHLAKLGRAITPENRVAYLTFGHKERKFKNTWRLYDLGLREPKRILALKKCRIAKKSDVLLYAELPDEMFYELIQLESGIDLDEAALNRAIGR